MKIVCDRLLLNNALSGVSKAVATSSALPIIEGILIECRDGVMTLTGYDLEMGIITSIPVQHEQDCRLVVRAKLLQDMVKRMTGDQVVIELGENLAVEVSGGSARFNFTGMNAEDYPELPSTPTEPAMSIKAGVLREIIERTRYAIAQNDQKPAHTGAKFFLEPGALTLVAVDGYRLAICRREVDCREEKSFVVPAKTLSEISRLIDDPEDTVSISTARRYGVINFGSYTVATRLLEGDFIDYKRAIPEECTTRVEIDVQSFAECVERSGLIITDRFRSPIRMKFLDGVAVLTCSTATGSSYDEITAPQQGPNIEIGFNNRYVLDALRNCGCEKVYFHIAGPTSPMKVTPVEGDDFLFLLLPVRIRPE